MSEDESVVLKPRELLSDAILTQNADELAMFMDQPTIAIAESMTALLAAGPKAWIGIAGRLIQATLKAKLFQQVSQEIKELREKGKIPDDFADEKKYKYGFKSWVELLTIIDEETPDAERLEALKAMFYSVNKVNAADGERIVAYQLFQIAKELASGELMLLKVIYETHKAGGLPKVPLASSNANAWRVEMARRSGHGLSALVEQNEKALAEYGLITPVVMSNQLQTIREENARLSDLGIRFCQNIETYHLETSADYASGPHLRVKYSSGEHQRIFNLRLPHRSRFSKGGTSLG